MTRQAQTMKGRTTLIAILAAASLLASCTADPVAGPDGRWEALFAVRDIAPVTVETRSLLTASDIETRQTAVTLAAYSGGVLSALGHYTSSLSAMPLTLERSRDYTVYALVNMGDMRSSLPSAEEDLDGLVYTIPSYTDGSSSVSVRGIPMAGSLAYSPRAGGSTAIPVERLLAKVTANLDCRWDGGTISSVRIRNMNGVLRPFGASAAASASDILPEQEFSEGTGSSSGTFVFYVPENLQGTISGISSSEGKSPDRNGTVRSRLDRLTYIETTVEASGDRTGTVVYSSLLGQNATTGFDIRRNCRYVWTIRFLEDGLQEDNWKIDTGDLSTYTYVHRLTLSPAEATLGVGSSQTYTARLYTDRYLNGVLVETDTVGEIISGSLLNWSSSSTATATVNASGTVTGVSPGTAIITATLLSDSSVKATATLTVYAAGTGIDTGWDDGGSIILD